MRVKNPATVQMIRDIIEGNTPPARVPESENAANVTESIGGAPLAEIFAADGKAVLNAACADKVKHALKVTAGGRAYSFDGAAAMEIDLEGIAPSAWKNGRSGGLTVEGAGTYQFFVPAADGATRGVSEILLVADLADTAFGALHPITGKNAAVRVCVEQGVIMVYTGENARTPTNCAVSVRKLFD